MLRDPLHWLDVRYKLALTFIGVCLVAFGVGGYLVSTSASRALEEEILLRLSYQCRTYADSLDANLLLLTRRAEDFASDGYIRQCVESTSNAAETREALRRHLACNKMPLVPTFLDLTVIGADGAVVVSARPVASPHLADVASKSADADGSWNSGMLAPTSVDEFPVQAISTPLRSLDGKRVVGRLVAWVRTGSWLAASLDGAGATPRGGDDSVALCLEDGAGREMTVPAALLAGGADAESEIARTGFGLRVVDAPAGDHAVGVARFTPRGGVIEDVRPLAANGWRVRAQLTSAAALQPVSGLQSRFLIVGLALALAVGAITFFPMRFVARPLVELREAARRVKDGDFGARVTPGSEDEIGELASTFNHMAEAIEVRTRRLEVAASEFAAQRDRLDAVIASMRDGLVVLDTEGKPALTNAAARPLLDLLAARDRRITSHYACDGAASVEGGCAACLFDASRPAKSCVVDVGARVYEIHVMRLPGGVGARRGRVLVSRDITDRVAQDERHIHQERVSVLGEVAAVMAHELNNPLAAISMFSQMVETGLPADSPYREHLVVVRRNTENCKRAIRELLDYATGAAPEVGEVDVHDVLDDVARFLAPLAERGGVEIRCVHGAMTTTLVGDEIQIRQVFVNLVLNAVQAMADGGGRVELATRTDGDHVVVDVTDTGPGIAEEAKPRLFEPFFTTKRRGAGTGLGLPTARRIAELHGGGVELVESAPGRTTFRVRLRCGATVSSAAGA
jgi:signal transduction histidine kinase